MVDVNAIKFKFYEIDDNCIPSEEYSCEGKGAEIVCSQGEGDKVVSKKFPVIGTGDEARTFFTNDPDDPTTLKVLANTVRVAVYATPKPLDKVLLFSEGDVSVTPSDSAKKTDKPEGAKTPKIGTAEVKDDEGKKDKESAEVDAAEMGRSGSQFLTYLSGICREKRKTNFSKDVTIAESIELSQMLASLKRVWKETSELKSIGSVGELAFRVGYPGVKAGDTTVPNFIEFKRFFNEEFLPGTVTEEKVVVGGEELLKRTLKEREPGLFEYPAGVVPTDGFDLSAEPAAPVTDDTPPLPQANVTSAVLFLKGKEVTKGPITVINDPLDFHIMLSSNEADDQGKEITVEFGLYEEADNGDPKAVKPSVFKRVRIGKMDTIPFLAGGEGKTLAAGGSKVATAWYRVEDRDDNWSEVLDSAGHAIEIHIGKPGGKKVSKAKASGGADAAKAAVKGAAETAGAKTGDKEKKFEFSGVGE